MAYLVVKEMWDGECADNEEDKLKVGDDDPKNHWVFHRWTFVLRPKTSHA